MVKESPKKLSKAERIAREDAEHAVIARLASAGPPVNAAHPPPAFFTEATEVEPRTSVDEDTDMSAASLTNEQRRLRRLARKPNVDHLEPGVLAVPGSKHPETGLFKMEVFPVFNVGDRIVVERHLAWAPDEWLDTRVYRVREIDDDTGHVKCLDEECNHHAVVGFKHPGQRFFLAPAKGDPFKAPAGRKAQNAGAGLPVVNGTTRADAPKKRGRPKGSKNRSKEEIAADKAARRAKK